MPSNQQKLTEKKIKRKNWQEYVRQFTEKEP